MTWEFWIDVGGTFTDCIARGPDEQIVACKVLSSAVTKGRVEHISDADAFTDPSRTADPPGFWNGYALRFFDNNGAVVHTATVQDFDHESGTLSTTASLPGSIAPKTAYELHSAEEAPILAIRRVLKLPLDEPIPPVVVKLGTTRGTNALLERKGAAAAFVTTSGFGDVLLIGNQDRPRLFDLAIQKPAPLFQQVVEIDERLAADGRVLKSPDEGVVRRQFEDLTRTGVESVAICLLHSFTNAEHERLVERIAREAGFQEVSVSSQLSPLIKLVSRGDTTVMDAYLNPVLRDYVRGIRNSLEQTTKRVGEERSDGVMEYGSNGVMEYGSNGVREYGSEAQEESSEPAPEDSAPPTAILHPRSSIHQSPSSILKLMSSAGGLVDADCFVGKDSILSGPAGGVIGFSRVAEQAGFPRSIGFDMGGTSTDVSRYDGRYELEYETQKAGVRVVAPMLAIETVAAGGGSVCGFDGVKLFVGPESAGADPGPACYGKGGPLTVTDVNLYLGKIIPSRFPFPLDADAVEKRLTVLCTEIEASPLGGRYTPGELALGFVEIANENMVRAIRNVSVSKGYDPADYVLTTFGGAGAQHACAIAASLGIGRILIHPYAGILSAYGIGMADVRRYGERSVLEPFGRETLAELESVFEELESAAVAEVRAEDVPPERIDAPARSLDMRYKGVDSTINVSLDAGDDASAAPEAVVERYAQLHERLYGYRHANRPIEVVAARVEVVGHTPDPPVETTAAVHREPPPSERREVRFIGGDCEAGVYLREDLRPGDSIAGPAILCEPTSTIVVDPDWRAKITERGEVLLETGEAGEPSNRTVRRTSTSVDGSPKTPTDEDIRRTKQIGTAPDVDAGPDPVLLEIFNNLFASIAEQMGLTLQRTSCSTNVKERLDFSCAIFSPAGDLVVNAPHIPVHLGAMSETVKRIIADNPEIATGDVFITNDPYRGGSHLPDVTVVTPVHHDETGELLFFTASRAHHAEIGGIVPGSMPPFSKTLADEGVLIRNFKLVDAGVPQESDLRELLLSGPHPTRSVDDNLADVSAQAAANRNGVNLLNELVDRYALSVVQAYMQHIQRAAAAKMRLALSHIPDGEYERVDHLDDGSPVAARITIAGDRATVDFTGTGPVLETNLNANRAITTAAVLYVFRCLIEDDIPLNSGVLEPVEIVLPECLLNPPEHADPAECAAVVGGNVETSQRVVDVLLGALGVAAASQGTMNNLTFGDDTFGYYETICGGSGATPRAPGADAVHTHMTNTRLTDVEVVERRYPVRVHEFAIRRGSGGNGAHRGGDGIVRRIEFLQPLSVSMLSERRGPYAPFGLDDGDAGELGKNTLARAGSDAEEDLGGKFAIQVDAGDVLTIRTPGGGGCGTVDDWQKD